MAHNYNVIKRGHGWFLPAGQKPLCFGFTISLQLRPATFLKLLLYRYSVSSFWATLLSVCEESFHFPLRGQIHDWWQQQRTFEIYIQVLNQVDAKKYYNTFMIRSCAYRDTVDQQLSCDLSWLSGSPVNPLAVGQFVNNRTKGRTCCRVHNYWTEGESTGGEIMS